MFRTVSVAGGDLRQLTIAKELADDGYDVTIYGFKKDMIPDKVRSSDSYKMVFNSDIIILPVPVSFDGITINMPFSDSKLTLDELTESINPLSIVFGGRITEDISKKLTAKGIKHFDYMKRDELAIRNAVPTAEGAIELAISETPITIRSSKCLVLGYGKVGKVLAHSLQALGAKTYVAARKYADLAFIDSHGCHPLTIRETLAQLGEFDIIFNTVPALILDADGLKKIPRSTLIIDLASKPGGVDFEVAKELGLRVIWALSLPGRIAPVTAGTIIKDTIINILRELEV